VSEDLGARWFSCMRRGNLEGAWAVSDEVLRRDAGREHWHLPRHQQPVWDGTPLEARRVLVRCYHGLGDTIQFIRYARPLRTIASEVIVWAQPELLPLLETASGVDRTEPLHDGAPDAEYDADVEIMELPHVFRSTLGTLPCEVPYLHAPRASVGRDAPLMVGLVARAGDWGTRRSVPLEELAPLAEVEGVSVRLLHPCAAPRREGPFITAGGTDTILGTASLIRALDLIIAPDTMPAHLAGALGAPVWTLLRREADWRWLHERDVCAWYPSMRLFRQETDGDWGSVVQRVLAALRVEVARRR
jgi:hypothetical protein